MGNRLTKIYTRTGDGGTTGLGDGQRIAKDHPIVEAIGTVDELNSMLGLLLCEELPIIIKDIVFEVQHRLFDIGGSLSIPNATFITLNHTTNLETYLDKLNTYLLPLKDFILPGGCRSASICHVARTICRRAERCTLQADKFIQMYLNRLSDLLFVISRYLNLKADIPDIFWEKNK